MKKNILLLSFLISSYTLFAQNKDTTFVYKKRVLESAEIEFLGSYYTQEGVHSSVNGGIGTEELQNYTGSVILSIPLNDDDILTIDAGFSAYTSASSSNINPFMSMEIATGTGASKKAWTPNIEKSQYKDGYDQYATTETVHYGSPWIASTGASRKDVLKSVNINYAHNSQDRNTIWNINGNASKEYDYSSLGLGAGIAKLFNDKNTEITLKASAYFDKWKAIYPTELHEYALYGLNFKNTGYFRNVDIFDQNGNPSIGYLPVAFTEFDNVNRNSYSFSVGLSQVVTKKLQISLFADILYQEGLLSTPYHRVYFADKANYYIGRVKHIPVYTSPINTEIFRLSDDVERLPDSRFKIPLGMRLNYYINDYFIARTYYRFYADSWNLTAHTFSLEIPVKLSQQFTLLPMYRFYTQKQAKYFAPFEAHYSYEKYYTSDYDLSSFDSHQYGMGISYTDILANTKLLSFGFKSIELRYNKYERSDSLEAHILSLGIKFVQ